MKSFHHILLFISILSFCSCNNKENGFNHFKYKEVKITIPYSIRIGDCLNWHTDFDYIKKSVIYKNRIISVGLYGGFCCIDLNSFKVDTAYTRKLNTDLFTNVSIIENTLYAELFNKIYYLDNKDNWVLCKNLLPIKYFNTLLEDNNYIFYYSTSGEWGSLLLAYNKKDRKTHGLITGCPCSVTKRDKEYLISTTLYETGMQNELLKILNIERLKEVSDTLRLRDYCWEKFYKQINDTSKAVNQYIEHHQYTKNWWDTSLVGSFVIQNNIYSFIKLDKKMHIGKIINDKVIILENNIEINPESIITYADNEKIVNEFFWSKGFSLIRDNTIYKFFFKNEQNERNQAVTSSKNYTFNYNQDNNKVSNPNQPEREIEFTYNNDYQIIGLYGNNLDGNYIIHNNKKYRLKIQSNWNFIDYIYVCDGNLFLNFMNLGNIDHKYRLLEITDIDKFINKYSESNSKYESQLQQQYKQELNYVSK